MSSRLTVAAGRGMTWMGISEALGQGLRLIALTILARLLSADDFGIVAMVAIVTELMLMITDLGFSEALIQRKDLTESHLSTCFWTGVLIGILQCIVISAGSPLIARLFGKELVAPVLAVSSIIFVIAPLRTVHGSILRKRLDFLRFSVAEVGVALTYVVASVIFAVSGFGIWSLIAGNLISQAILVVLRWTLCRWRPSFTFSRKSMSELWGFGASITGNRIVQTLGSRLDQLLIGRFLSAASLGFYFMGAKIPQALTNPVWTVINRVAFPAFSLIQNEQERARRGYLRGVNYLSLVALPAFSGLALIAPELVRVLWGESWSPSIIPMQILCIPAAVSVINTLAGSFLLSRGKPNVIFMVSLLKLLLMIPAIWLGVRFGMSGVASSVAAVTIIIWLIYQALVNKIFQLTWRELGRALRTATIGSIIIAALLLIIKTTLFRTWVPPDIVVVIGFGLLGALIYLTVVRLVDAYALQEIVRLLKEVLRSDKKGNIATHSVQQGQ